MLPSEMEVDTCWQTRHLNNLREGCTASFVTTLLSFAAPLHTKTILSILAATYHYYQDDLNFLRSIVAA
jgi:hypothetical protein